MIQTNKLYKFKEEFCKLLQIPPTHYDRKQPQLLQWLTVFYDYELIGSRPICILIKEIYGPYQPLPHELPDLEQEYTNFTLRALGDTYKPNSIIKIAQDATAALGYHTNVKAIAKRYIQKPFQANGETNHRYRWVWRSSYTPLTAETIETWRQILSQENISDLQAANGFYSMLNGESISAQLAAYRKACGRMQKLYPDYPVLAQEWRLIDNQ